jgi:MFS family permease
MLWSYDDGLIDLLAAALLLGFGLALWIDMPWLVGILPALLVSLGQPLKSSITAGRVDDGTSRPLSGNARAAMVGRWLLLGLVALFGLMLMAGFGSNPMVGQLMDLLGRYPSLFFGLVAASSLLLLARLLSHARFLAYAALSLFIFGGGHVLAVSVPLSVILLASIMLLSGSLVLIRFLIMHPREY